MNSKTAALAYYARAYYTEGLSTLEARRRISAPPLSRPERLRNDARLAAIAETLAAETETNHVSYYGHPARRTGYVATVAAFPSPDAYRRIAAACAAPLSRTACAYTFPI